ncbi:phosphoglycerate mutase-like protein [Xylariaceae sp. FL0016]|nr:phosphoglycerate mutase-like protein [Xylariaceae sp. FL0016]
MHLLLIRHGESVDNVASLYAGSRDSPLTNHGVLQTKRLGSHLASRLPVLGPIRDIFASNLQRAHHTAEAIAKALPTRLDNQSGSEPLVEVVCLPELREKDFGLSEGKKFGTRGQSGDDGSETRDAMKIRIDRFLDSHLTPLIEENRVTKCAVVVVAHGIILNVLLKCLMARYPGPPVSGRSSEYVASWSNTGVLQAKLVVQENVRCRPGPEADSTSEKNTGSSDLGVSKVSLPRAPPKMSLVVDFVNNVDHLQGLKKTRGGIGSVGFDAKQRTMDSFFTSSSKKRKLG